MDAVEAANATVDANKNHQSEILDFVAACDIRLKSIKSLLARVTQLEKERAKLGKEEIDNSSDEVQSEDDLFIHVKDSIKAQVPSNWADFSSEDSPFRHDLQRQQRYHALTTPHPWTPLEREDLKRSVQAENRRRVAERAVQKGVNPIEAIEDVSFADLARDTDGISWENVAKTLAHYSSVHPPRTGMECRMQYLAIGHPDIDKDQWSDEEEEKLREIVDGFKSSDEGLDWNKVVILLKGEFGKNRTVLQCLRTYRLGSVKTYLNVPWTRAEDDRLRDAIARYGMNNWAQVALYVGERRSTVQVRVRWQNTLNPSLKRGRWRTEEDEALRRAVRREEGIQQMIAEKEGREVKPGNLRWAKIAEEVPGRTNIQCGARWREHLNPELKSAPEWTEEEDALLVKLKEQEKLKFQEIATRFPGRTRFTCTRRYKELVNKRPPEVGFGDEAVENIPPPVNQSEGGEERNEPRERPRTPVPEGDNGSSIVLPQGDAPVENVPTAEAESHGARRRPKPRPRKRKADHLDDSTGPAAA